MVVRSKIIPMTWRFLVSIGIVLFLLLFAVPTFALATPPTFDQYRLLFRGPDLTKSVAIGDMDGDGDLDIVVGNIGENNEGEQSVIYLNDGLGYFTTAWFWGTANDKTTSVAIGDMDNDGDLDIVAGKLEQPNAIYLNEGADNFPLAYSFGTGQDKTQSVALGDMDGDSDLDIVVGNDGAQNAVYLNDDNHFSRSQPFGTGQDKTQSVALGDMDGDSDLDIVVGNDGTQNAVYLNDGDNFNRSQPFGTGLDQTQSIAIGDMNGDHKPDLIVGNLGEQNAIYWNADSVPFTNSSPFGPGQDPTKSVAVGDMDGDRDLDIVVGNHQQQDRIYFNKDTNTFTTQRPFGTGSDGTQSVALGDIDGDGDLDIVVGNGEPSIEQNAIYLNDGASSFDTEGQLPKRFDKTKSVAVGDMDGDGDLDLVIGNAHEQNLIYLNDVSGNFTTEWPFGTGTDDTQSVAVGDMDGDGDLDLVVGNAGEQGAVEHSTVYLNGQNGDFSQSISFGDGMADTQSVAVGDLDGDGRLDIVLGNSGRENAFYLNKGGGNFASQRLLDSGIYDTHTIAIGDMDQDGDLDLVVGNIGESNIIYTNDGNSNFNAAHAFGTGKDDTRSVALGDVDGDGRLDIAVGNVGEQSAVYLNKGAGDFNVARPFGTGLDDTRSVAFGDMDGDGDLDLVVGNVGDPNVVYLNDGQGNFTGDIPFGTGSDSTQSVAIGDLNRDGRLDLVVGNMQESDSGGQDSGEQNAIYLNQSLPSAITTGRPGSTANANFFSTAMYLTDTVIAIPYTLYESTAQTVGKIRACYSFDGGAHWQLAIAAGQPLVTPAAVVVPGQGCPYVPAWEKSNQLTQTTAITGVPYTFLWDTFASGFFGQSDAVVVRIEAYPDLHPQPEHIAGPYQHPLVSAATFPFRVRGTQIQVVDETGNAVPNALVYQLRNGQTIDGVLLASNNTPFRTNGLGYLQGRGAVGLSDRLLALAPQPLPLTTTMAWASSLADVIHLYYTNGTPTEGGVETAIRSGDMSAFTPMVMQPGVQILPVAASRPLFLFDLNVALEWDASADPEQKYLRQLTADLEKTATFLYDFSNGQATLGQITVTQNAENWAYADVLIQATNRLRPLAVQGGIVTTMTTDLEHGDILYAPGQVRMGATWNRYGEAGQNLGADWPLALAHELSHYLFFQEDTYLGLDEQGLLIAVDRCLGSVMGDMYNPSGLNTEFVPDADWLPSCANTLANRTLGRSEWATLRQRYPALFVPNHYADNVGPLRMPFNLTTVSIITPALPTQALPDPIYFLRYAGQSDQVASPGGRAFLLRGDQFIYDLGSPIGGQNRLLTRAPRPGDRLCVFDPPLAQYGCEIIESTDEELQMEQDTTWTPAIEIRPITTKTVAVAVSGLTLPATYSLQARLYPEYYTATVSIPLMLQDGVYRGLFALPYPALVGYVQLWVDEPYTETNPRRETIVGYTIGGNIGPSTTMDPPPSLSGGKGPAIRYGGPAIRYGGPGLRSGNAPLASADGQMIFFNANFGVFQPGELYVVQNASALPALPTGKRVVGLTYSLLASPNLTRAITGSVSFQYLGIDALALGITEEQEPTLQIHLWQPEGGWQALATVLNARYNLASAPAAGVGLYALLAGNTQSQVTKVAPTVVFTALTTTVTLTGQNFLAPVNVILQVNDSPVYTRPAQVLNPNLLTFDLPPSVVAQEYHLTLINGDQTRTAVAASLTVLAQQPDVCFYDDFESGPNQWQSTGQWGIVALPDNGGHAITDSPQGNYNSAPPASNNGGRAITTLTSSLINLDGCAARLLTFRHAYVIATGNGHGDWGRVEIALGDSENWVPVAHFNGGGPYSETIAAVAGDEWKNAAWQDAVIDLSQYSGAIRLRFTLEVDQNVADKGWVIDKVQIGPYHPSGQQVNQQFLPLIANS